MSYFFFIRKQCWKTICLHNIRSCVCQPEWRSKQSPDKPQCSRRGRDQKLPASLWKGNTCQHPGVLLKDGPNVCEHRHLPVHHHRLIHLIKKGYIRVPARINGGDEQWCCCISACGTTDSRLSKIMFTSCPAGRCVCEPAAGNA